MLLLTDNDIREDIRGFEQRIQEARDKMAALPKGRLHLKDHRRREKIRRNCKNEIEHVKALIGYAEEALNPWFHRHIISTGTWESV